MQPTKDNIEKMLDYLSDKTLSFGCLVECPITKRQRVYLEPTSSGGARLLNDCVGDSVFTAPAFSDFKIIGHPVMIGDVLKARFELFSSPADNACWIYLLTSHWQPFGINSSLNETLSGVVIRRKGGVIGPISGGSKIKVKPSLIFKDPNTQALWALLCDVFADALSDVINDK